MIRLGFIIACIICGLTYLHKMNVIHKDIKPSNLVIDNTGYIQIADFGISQSLNKRDLIYSSGTPGYMGKLLCYNSA